VQGAEVNRQESSAQPTDEYVAHYVAKDEEIN
jgi:hypothetical protein